MNCGQVRGTNWKPHGIWQCKLHARQNCLVSVLSVLICSLIKHRGKYIHKKLTPKSFCVIDFFFLPLKTYFVIMEFLVRKCCLHSVCILYSAQFTYWKRSFICEVCNQIVCAVSLAVTICLFVDAHFKLSVYWYWEDVCIQLNWRRSSERSRKQERSLSCNFLSGITLYEQ